MNTIQLFAAPLLVLILSHNADPSPVEPREVIIDHDDHPVTNRWSHSICGHFNNASTTLRRGSRVIGGRDAPIEEFPWQVSLQRFRLALPLPIPDWGHLCGAAILNEYWLLTAAHCVDGLVNSIFPGQMRAVIGTDRWRYTLLQRDIQMINIQRIVIHPDWNARKAQNDIALIRTAKSITFGDRAKPICLPPTEDYNTTAGQTMTVAGFGYTTDNLLLNVLPTKLQMVQIPVVKLDNCRDAYNRTRIPITDRMICAGTSSYGRCTGAMKGDSGSPLISYDASGRAIHTGIVSFSLPCRFTGAPDVYTRTAPYVRWIETVISSKI